ncbi:unnamed protein product [Zymoseptoria tritici ST99CH_3D7]|uniref:C3H1-type domain-containing protein n=1 Tax=Zymoseptoria tritici (strain ST99CH_3D7) TaxID=1276538 RepID=A0A1X7S7A8_ZYMT9|nr:unnamed protein product [Zymoseptoria tritici ST99CH_3D7]
MYRNNRSREVCKFFLEGRCRFGNDCKFEHPSNQAPQSSNQNRFAPLQNPANANQRGRPGAVTDPKQEPFNVTAEGIRLDLTEASQKGERPQWQFSSYGPGIAAPKQLLEGPNVEMSEEELRVMCYLAKATGRLQDYDAHVNGLRTQINQQVQTVLQDLEGAKRFVQNGQNEHPNRNDMAQSAGSVFPWTNRPSLQATPAGGFGQAAANSGTAFGRPSGGGFGQPSAMGAPSGFGSSGMGAVAASGFGQPSNLAAKPPAFGQPAFGAPSQPAAGAFGQPSAFGAAAQQPQQSAFGKPSAPTSGFGQSAFGQASKPAGSAFGAPSFGQAAQPAFGQASQPTTGAFGQPSQPGGAFGQSPQPTSAFGQASQPTSTFGQASQSSTAFGQASQPQSAFGQASQPQSGFGQASQPPSGFGQASQPSGFNRPSPFAQATQQPTQNGFGSSAPQQNNGIAQPNGQHPNHWKGRPVQFDPEKKVPFIIDPQTNAKQRIWFLEGPPTGAAPMTEAPPEAYEGEQGIKLKELYDHVRTTGTFKDGFMPEIPPKREWVSFDL